MARSGDDGFDQRLDRWVEAGRQLVDGVAGARPGSRSGSRAGQRRSASRLNPGELGRWVEDKLEWLLDDEGGDDWREPWQQQRSPAAPSRGGRRRPLEAISRRAGRSSGLAAPATTASTMPNRPMPAPADGDAWPADDDFSVPRWQRQPGRAAAASDADARPDPSPRSAAAADRPLPRSSRRR